MKNRILTGIIAAAFVLAVGLTAPAPAVAGVNVDISIPLFGLFAAGVYAAGPPVYVAPPPPPVYYYPPQPVEGAVFYGGYWYRPNAGSWYISAQAGGPWSFIAVERVPYPVISGPVLMQPAPAYGYGRPMMGPGYGRGWYGHRHDD